MAAQGGTRRSPLALGNSATTLQEQVALVLLCGCSPQKESNGKRAAGKTNGALLSISK
jgi:hypothetical protein